jgi:hypothetical protein
MSSTWAGVFAGVVVAASAAVSAVIVVVVFALSPSASTLKVQLHPLHLTRRPCSSQPRYPCHPSCPPMEIVWQNVL